MSNNEHTDNIYIYAKYMADLYDKSHKDVDMMTFILKHSLLLEQKLLQLTQKP